MMLLPCPWCGLRAADEFHYVGEAKKRPDPVAATEAEWRAYLYFQANPCGWTVENWYHRSGCRRFIKIERHTGTNAIKTATPGPLSAGVSQ